MLADLLALLDKPLAPADRDGDRRGDRSSAQKHPQQDRPGDGRGLTYLAPAQRSERLQICGGPKIFFFFFFFFF